MSPSRPCERTVSLIKLDSMLLSGSIELNTPFLVLKMIIDGKAVHLKYVFDPFSVFSMLGNCKKRLCLTGLRPSFRQPQNRSDTKQIGIILSVRHKQKPKKICKPKEG